MNEKDDFLRELMQNTPLDSPSDDFVDRVMANIQIAPELVREKRSYLFYLKTFIPYLVLTLVVIVIISTSDLPIFNWLPGKDYFLNNFLPYIGSLFIGLKNAFASKYVSFGLLISVSAGLLFLIDRLFSRRTAQ